ncbi:lamin tail domain-containing protein 1 [Carlito syrichta]|uniref:Lamin tail domain-containing protein 1 n=1 Tax=Carlito syrichta TaxID=1868482 RepID=A0A1U7TB14_CARSF|nr:lamin tail domain-containing protein 1 [Carlito syrichta]
MKDTQDIQEASEALQSEVHKQEDKMEKQEQREDKLGASPVKQQSSVHFYSKMSSSDTTTPPSSWLLSNGIPLGYPLSSPQTSEVVASTTGPVTSKATISCCSQAENNSVLKKQAEPPVIGEGEDYFHSLFGDSKKLTAHSRHAEKTYKHFSMILEEAGQYTSSSLGDIKIAEVNTRGLFVKLVNTSLDKELTIGDHILQQNVNGQTISLYRFPPNIIMQANSTVKVWAAASEAKHQPPSDFLWKEQDKFRTSSDCTTILCKPNGQAVTWYTPIHWKQAYKKLETDIEFDRCSVVTPSLRRHMFQWTASTTTMSKEKQDQRKKDISNYQVEQTQGFLKRVKEIPPTLFPNRSPWCQSPYVAAHPYSPLIEPYNTCTTGSSMGRQPRSQSTRPDPAPGAAKASHGHRDPQRQQSPR